MTIEIKYKQEEIKFKESDTRQFWKKARIVTDNAMQRLIQVN